jgi:hypothetical protein
METEQVIVRTISPMYVPLELKTGVNRLSKEYMAFKERLETPNIYFLNKNFQKEYEFISHDSWDHRLFFWRDKALNPNLVIHVFPNNIAIAVIEHIFDYDGNVDELESKAQKCANELIEQSYSSFTHSIKKLNDDSTNTFFNFDKVIPKVADIFWVSRALILTN